MDQRHLQGLNGPQLEAVQHIEGPLLVLAGAGTGKTRVITHRIAYLIANRIVPPDRILGVTFTNKAAGEMKERVIGLLGPIGRLVRLSTFHSFSARLLRDQAEKLGYSRDFTIYDSADSGALAKRIIKDLLIPEGQPSPGGALEVISRAKDRLIGPEKFAEQTGQVGSVDEYILKNIAAIYRKYQAQLKKNNALDFDDLLFMTVTLFDKFPEVLGFYQNRFPFLLVDEYQDTNHVQYRLVKMLAGDHKNICVVGDDDQSIYGWRGADINNILNFEEDFAGCKVIKLEQNYRSTSIVLEAAHEVIRKIGGRKAKKLFTDRIGGDIITLMLCGDDRDEAEAVARRIKTGLTFDKSPKDFAIMYRTHAQSRAIEDAMRDAGIPYKIIGGTKFYDRKEVKDIIAYLRLLINPDDTESLLRIINVPRRKIGKVTIDKLLAASAQANISAFELMGKPDMSGLKGQAADELQKLHGILKGLTARLEKLGVDEIAARLIDQVGYIRMLEKENTPEADVRIDNVKELVNAIIAYMERVEEEEEESEGDDEAEPQNIPTLQGFLEEVALISEIDALSETDEAVVLMTLHAAKGLEFDTVFLTGMEQGLFPIVRDEISRSSSDSFDEERRLCYVGITRAKRKLFLSLAGFRRRYDGPNISAPSCFLQDIPEKLIEVERHNYYDNYLFAPAGARTGYSRANSPKPMRRHNKSDYDVAADDEVSPDEIIKIGMAVSHSKFGTGRIIDREGSGEDMILTIQFKGGTKKIMPKYAGLEILGV